MLVPRSDERQVIDDLICNRDEPLFDKVAELEGVELVEPGDFRQDRHYKCIQYVFSTVYHEEWCTPDIEDTKDGCNLQIAAEEFLGKRGYQVVKEPQDGDVAAYFDPNMHWPFRFDMKHWGIYENGKVVSKFGQGHIFKHDIDKVPNLWGSEVMFFRKD